MRATAELSVQKVAFMSVTVTLASVWSVGCIENDRARLTAELLSAGEGISTTEEMSSDSPVGFTTTGVDDSGEDGGTGSGADGTTLDMATAGEASTGLGETGGDESALKSRHPPVCGDGVVSADEECDGGDGCDQKTCLRDRWIFVSSEEYAGNFGGIHDADALCDNLAKSGENPLLKSEEANFRVMKAWLSGKDYEIGAWIELGRGRYFRPDGVLVAERGEDLLVASKPLLAPISVDENGEPRDVYVWTNTKAGGGSASENDHCDDWNSVSNLKVSWIGSSKAKDPQWTHVSSDLNPAPCGFKYHLYCVEQRGGS